jgi:GMP synthase-like glutamine amidotransferase
VDVLLLGNRDDADPGFVGEHLEARGARLRLLPREEPESWPGLDGADLVLVLGSDWSVYWPHVEREVAAETALLQAAHAADRPVFGICYGAQILAHALGGSVRPADWVEIGWLTVDSVRPDTIHPGPWFVWHVDTFAPPPEATVLASTAVGPHAFALGRTFAVQFHPEVDERIVGRWAAGWGKSPLEGLGVDADDLVARTRAGAVDARPRAHALIDWFLDQA